MTRETSTESLELTTELHGLKICAMYNLQEEKLFIWRQVRKIKNFQTNSKKPQCIYRKLHFGRYCTTDHTQKRSVWTPKTGSPLCNA